MNFRKKLIIPITFLILLSISILGTVIYFNVQSTFETQMIEQSDDQLSVVEFTINNQSDLSKIIKNEIGESYLSAAMSIAMFINDNPNMLNTASLDKLSKELMLDQINIVDGEGIITHSTLDSFIGYNMEDSEQSKPFFNIISGEVESIVQQPEPRGADGILYQYLGIKRLDAPGFIQVGLDPIKVKYIDEKLKIDDYIRNMSFGEDGYAFILDSETGNTLVHPNTSLEGGRVEQDFIDDMLRLKNGQFKYTFEGLEKMLVFKTINGNIVAVTQSLEALNNLKRTIFLLIISISLICLVVSIVCLYFIVTKFALKPVKKVVEAIGEMEKGNLNVQISNDSKDEFGDLSRSFNNMAKNMKDLLFNIINLSGSLDNSFSNINDNTRGIGLASEEVAKTVQEMSEGASNQAEDANDALALTNLLSTKVGSMTSSLNNVMKSSNEMSEKNDLGLETLIELKDKLHENEIASLRVSKDVLDLSDKSILIGSILDTIENISEQINLLSLNAAIEEIITSIESLSTMSSELTALISQFNVD